MCGSVIVFMDDPQSGLVITDNAHTGLVINDNAQSGLVISYNAHIGLVVMGMVLCRYISDFIFFLVGQPAEGGIELTVSCFDFFWLPFYFGVFCPDVFCIRTKKL